MVNKIEKMTDVAPFVQDAGQNGTTIRYWLLARESGKIDNRT